MMAGYSESLHEVLHLLIVPNCTEDLGLSVGSIRIVQNFETSRVKAIDSGVEWL